MAHAPELTQVSRIARQPIFNAQKQVVAYELLYRSSNQNSAGTIEGDHATSSVLMNAFVNIGLEELVGDKPAFVNLTRDFLASDELLPDAPHKIVIEVLEDIIPDDELIEKLKSLAQRGFTIALDDFVLDSTLTPLLGLADIVKVELPAIPPSDLAEHVEALRAFSARLLAEKVETYEEFEACRQLGFDMFQGYFLSRPEILQTKNLCDNQLAAIRVLAKLSEPDLELSELESIITLDATLTYKLLRFANSSHIGLRRTVSSVKHVLALLGISGIRNLVALLTLAGITEAKPPELMRMAFIRAQMASQLASTANYENPPAYFMGGLVSLLDAMLDQSLDEVVKQLPLDDAIANGVLCRGGSIGEVLNCVEAYERGDFEKARLTQVDDQAIDAAYWSAAKAAKALDEVD